MNCHPRMLLSGIWFIHRIPGKTLGNDRFKVRGHVITISRPLSTLRTIILNFESGFKKAESKAIYREDAKIARKSINLSFLKKVFPSGLLASLAPSRFMQLKFWSEACLANNSSSLAFFSAAEPGRLPGRYA